MPVTTDKPAPYAPASAILELIQRHRHRGLPTPVTADVLQRAGISDSLIPRTVQALQALDLIDEQGKATPTLEGLRLAPEAEYRERLSEWLKSAYADVLVYVDLSKDDETRVRDAFRHYQPVGQQPRMVTLFMGLAAAAGMAGDKSVPHSRRGRAVQNPIPKKPPPKLPQPPAEAVGRFSAHGKSHVSFQSGTPSLPTPLAGLLSSLPPEGGTWNQARRDKFVATFEAVIDFCYGIEEEPSSPLAKDENTKGEEVE